jgi:putative transposase
MAPAPDREDSGRTRIELVGRPQVDDAVAALIERMARVNTGWGYRRIQCELHKLGHRIAASTVHRVLKRLRIPPVRR